VTYFIELNLPAKTFDETCGISRYFSRKVYRIYSSENHVVCPHWIRTSKWWTTCINLQWDNKM